MMRYLAIFLRISVSESKQKTRSSKYKNMNNKFDDKLQARNIKLTAMRQLVLEVLTEEKTAISLPEPENRIEPGR